MATEFGSKSTRDKADVWKICDRAARAGLWPRWGTRRVLLSSLRAAVTACIGRHMVLTISGVQDVTVIQT